MSPATIAKRRPWVLLAMPALLLVVSTALAQSGGSYDLSWNTIDGGGGTSSGGSYVLNGTAGQPDASALTGGGSYALIGGFWGEVISTSPGGGYSIYLPVILR